jgi:peptide-methionine (R)-S-oxide reductase
MKIRKRHRASLIASFCLLFLSCRSQQTNSQQSPAKLHEMKTPAVIRSEEEWKKILSPQEYKVLREAGTDYPFTGKYTDLDQAGNYYCRACGNLLFHSGEKYHSGCGWPAFFDTADSSAIITRLDESHGMVRVEVLCGKCHSHLGHVFEDGPKDKTGLRYCINSTSLDFNSGAKAGEPDKK